MVFVIILSSLGYFCPQLTFHGKRMLLLWCRWHLQTPYGFYLDRIEKEVRVGMTSTGYSTLCKRKPFVVQLLVIYPSNPKGAKVVISRAYPGIILALFQDLASVFSPIPSTLLSLSLNNVDSPEKISTPSSSELPPQRFRWKDRHNNSYIILDNSN